MADSGSTLDVTTQKTSGPESTKQDDSPSKPVNTVEPAVSIARTDGGELPATHVSQVSDTQETKIDPEASAEWSKLNQLVRSLPEIKSYSQAKRIANGLLGPTVRLWRRNNVISVGYEHGGQKFILGEAKDYSNALKLTMFTLAHAKARAAHAAKQNVATTDGEGNMEIEVGPKTG